MLRVVAASIKLSYAKCLDSAMQPVLRDSRRARNDDLRNSSGVDSWTRLLKMEQCGIYLINLAKLFQK